jgi:hypothetical protein
MALHYFSLVAHSNASGQQPMRSNSNRNAAVVGHKQHRPCSRTIDIVAHSTWADCYLLQTCIYHTSDWKPPTFMVVGLHDTIFWTPAKHRHVFAAYQSPGLLLWQRGAAYWHGLLQAPSSLGRHSFSILYLKSSALSILQPAFG